MSRALLALLIIPLAAPIEAGSPFGGFHGPASHHGFPVFHHRGSRARRFLAVTFAAMIAAGMTAGVTIMAMAMTTTMPAAPEMAAQVRDSAPSPRRLIDGQGEIRVRGASSQISFASLLLHLFGLV